MHMQIRRPISFFKNTKKRLLESDMLRFLLFIECMPKHRVMDGINILFLSSLSVICFLAGLFGFMVFGSYGLVGLTLYEFVVLVGVLELLHCLFDR
jgi:hypothetical protein